jgi:hypothetical protein
MVQPLMTTTIAIHANRQSLDGLARLSKQPVWF